MPKRSTTESFWKRLTKTDSGCWEFSGCKSSDGYGRLIFQGRKLSAHRLAYELTEGAIPDGMAICHKCDNPPCCNPDHLFLGTQADNVADRVAKGREGYRKGEKNGRAKLTDALVIDIRQKLSAGTRTKADIGREYCVSEVLIGMIARRKVWTHV